MKKLYLLAVLALAGCNQPYNQGNMSCKVKAGYGFTTCVGGPMAGTECLMTVQDGNGKVLYEHRFSKPIGAPCNLGRYPQ